MNKAFWKSALVRMARTFLQVVLGMWTASTLITQVDWKLVLLSAVSSAIYSLLTSLLAGLPEVDYVAQDNGYAEDDEDDEDEEENYDDFMGEETDE